jgi:hypothetical protein
MIKDKIFLALIFTGLIVAILHTVALFYYLYWIFEWFDILMHFLGGLFAAFVSLFAYKFLLSEKFHNNKMLLINTLIAVLIIGIVWEIFELYFDITYADEGNYIGDTILDYIMDLIGAYFGFLYYKSVNKF